MTVKQNQLKLKHGLSLLLNAIIWMLKQVENSMELITKLRLVL